VNASALPEQQAWGDAAKAVVEAWFPEITALLCTDDYEVPAEIRLVIVKEARVPAYTSGATSTINGQWITAHPDDLGMVVHELVHVVQHYPGRRNTPGWLTEGIADYIRCRLVFELDKALRRREDPMAVFTTLTGKDADALWAEFLAQNP